MMLSQACAAPKIAHSTMLRRAPHRPPCSSRNTRIAPCTSAPGARVIFWRRVIPMRNKAFSSKAGTTPIGRSELTNGCRYDRAVPAKGAAGPDVQSDHQCKRSATERDGPGIGIADCGRDLVHTEYQPQSQRADDKPDQQDAQPGNFGRKQRTTSLNDLSQCDFGGAGNQRHSRDEREAPEARGSDRHRVIGSRISKSDQISGAETAKRETLQRRSNSNGDQRQAY